MCSVHVRSGTETVYATPTQGIGNEDLSDIVPFKYVALAWRSWTAVSACDIHVNIIWYMSKSILLC